MSSISNNTNRVAGLISGLETEDLVKAMSANTKSRINSKKQKLQTLEWKQESYRSIIDKISDFRDKYLRIESANSIKANAVMKKCKATSSDDKVISASASAGAIPGKYTISEATSAKTASVSTSGAAAEGSVKLDFSDAVEGRNYEVKVTLDGAERTVIFKGGANEKESAANFLTAANLAFDDIKNSKQSFEFDGDNWLKFNNGDDDVYHTFEVGRCDGLGLESNTSSKITKSSTLSSIGFAQALSSKDGKYNININGVDFEFTDDTTVSEMLNKVNESDAGVKMSFSNVSQSFTIESKETGAGQEINLYQKKGNLLNSLLNIGSDKLGTSDADSAKLEYAVNDSYTQKISDELKDKLINGFGKDDKNLKLTLNVDGVDKEFTIDISMLRQADEGHDNEFSADQINAVLGKQLGDDIKLSYSDGKLTIQSDKTVKIGKNDLDLEEGATNEKMVVGDKNYTIAEGVKEMTFHSGGKPVTVKAADGKGIKVNDLVEAGLFDIRSDGTFVAVADVSWADQAAKDFLKDTFGKTSIEPSKTTDTLTAYGSNSKLVLSSDGENFTTYTSATNTFNFEGTTINVSSAKDFKAESEEDYITVDTEKDTSALKDLIKGFVDDYNKLLDDLYGEISTSRPKSSGSYYDPLTEEQEEEMSDKEIEKWNENAKTGLLYNDRNVSKFLGDIRGAMSTFVDKFGLYNMGIELTDDWRDNGKIEIADESKLDAALAANGDKVAELFTSENGIAARLEKAVDKAISTKTNKYGYLTSLAGQKNTKTDTDNSIYKQIQSIKDIIDKLEEKYEDEQKRYWDKFTALEKYMAQMQQQQSYFTSE